MADKNKEKEAKVQAQKKLQAVVTKLKRYTNKDERVQELRRSVNDLTTTKEAHDRAEER